MSINYQFGYVSEFKASYGQLTTNCAITHEPFAFFWTQNEFSKIFSASKIILQNIFTLQNHLQNIFSFQNHFQKTFSCHKIIFQNHFPKIIFMSQNHFAKHFHVTK